MVFVIIKTKKRISWIRNQCDGFQSRGEGGSGVTKRYKKCLKGVAYPHKLIFRPCLAIDSYYSTELSWKSGKENFNTQLFECSTKRGQVIGFKSLHKTKVKLK